MYSLNGMSLSVNNGWILDFHGIVGKIFIFVTFRSHSVDLLQAHTHYESTVLWLNILLRYLTTQRSKSCWHNLPRSRESL